MLPPLTAIRILKQAVQSEHESGLVQFSGLVKESSKISVIKNARPNLSPKIKPLTQSTYTRTAIGALKKSFQAVKMLSTRNITYRNTPMPCLELNFLTLLRQIGQDVLTPIP